MVNVTDYSGIVCNKREQQEKLRTYYPFFNTEPQIGCIVVGITAGLEEARANGAEGIDDEMINGIRAGLMGPLAGIGDSLIVGTYIPILLGIAVGFAEGGSVLGPLFYIVVWNLTSIIFQKFVYDKGYELGASWVNITTPIQIATNSEGEPVLLQGNLDGAFPKILTMLFVLFAWWLMAKKNITPIKVLFLFVIIGFLGSVAGILG